uniref:Uncharacterized protein n=1 Tax=Ditylenchus dipsaci TaxID=166011 RepID=A0A915EC15_9BILA
MGMYDEEKEWRCCCGVHVEKAAYVFTFLGAGISALMAFSYYMAGNIGYGTGTVVAALMYFCIPIAQHTRQPVYYLPFLIINAISKVLYVIYILFLLYLIIATPVFFFESSGHSSDSTLTNSSTISTYSIHSVDSISNSLQEKSGKTNSDEEITQIIRLSLVYYLVGTALYLILVSFFYHIIHHAYKYMKQMTPVKPVSKS